MGNLLLSTMMKMGSCVSMQAYVSHNVVGFTYLFPSFLLHLTTSQLQEIGVHVAELAEL